MCLVLLQKLTVGLLILTGKGDCLLKLILIFSLSNYQVYPLKLKNHDVWLVFASFCICIIVLGQYTIQVSILSNVSNPILFFLRQLTIWSTFSRKTSINYVNVRWKYFIVKRYYSELCLSVLCSIVFTNVLYRHFIYTFYCRWARTI